MEHWKEIPLNSTEVDLIKVGNVSLHHGNFLVCEEGIVALTASAVTYKPSKSQIKWALPLVSISEPQRESRGYLNSGKIYLKIILSNDDKEQSNASNLEKIVWTCQVCEEVNESLRNQKESPKCQLCGSIQKGTLQEIRIDASETDAIKEEIDLMPWKCEVCEETNGGDLKSCQSCGFGRPAADFQVQMNSIKCSTCSFISKIPGGHQLNRCQVCEGLLNESGGPPPVDKVYPKYKLTFKSGSSTIFHGKLLTSWQEARAKNSVQKAEDAVASESLVVGISGLLKRQEEMNRVAEASLSAAFSDLDALMRSADEMVRLAAKISEKISNSSSSAATAAAGTDKIDKNERRVFNELIDSLGIESRTDDGDDGAGGFNSDFYAATARNVSNLIEALIARTGTRVFSLADVYCLYNRTRTTGSLIAPADLLKAGRLMSQLGLPVRLHKFTKKGMLCLVPAQDVDPHHLFTQIHQLLTEKSTEKSVTAVDLAERMKISVFLAGQQLAMAESAGKIVKDGKRRDIPAYYANIILTGI